MGLLSEPTRGQAGIGWLRLVTDIPTALSEIVHGHLRLGSYFTSLKSTRVESVFCREDPLPSSCGNRSAPISDQQEVFTLDRSQRSNALRFTSINGQIGQET